MKIELIRNAHENENIGCQCRNIYCSQHHYDQACLQYAAGKYAIGAHVKLWLCSYCAAAYDNEKPDKPQPPVRKRICIGMDRPEFNTVWIKACGNIWICQCGLNLLSREALFAHWQLGHMDTPQYKTIDVPANEAD